MYIDKKEFEREMQTITRVHPQHSVAGFSSLSELEGGYTERERDLQYRPDGRRRGKNWADRSSGELKRQAATLATFPPLSSHTAAMPQQLMSGMDYASAEIRPQQSNRQEVKELTEEGLAEGLETELGKEHLQTSDLIKPLVPGHAMHEASDLCDTEMPTNFCYDAEYALEQQASGNTRHLASYSEQAFYSTEQPALSYSTEQPALSYFTAQPTPYPTEQQAPYLTKQPAFYATNQLSSYTDRLGAGVLVSVAKHSTPVLCDFNTGAAAGNAGVLAGDVPAQTFNSSHGAAAGRPASEHVYCAGGPAANAYAAPHASTLEGCSTWQIPSPTEWLATQQAMHDTRRTAALKAFDSEHNGGLPSDINPFKTTQSLTHNQALLSQLPEPDTAWTLAMLGHRNAEFDRDLQRASTCQLRRFDENSATVMAMAMAAASNGNAEFMSDLMLTSFFHLRNFSPLNLTKMLSAVVSYCDSAAIRGRSFVLTAELQLPRFKDEDLVDIMEALADAASIDYINPAFVYALVMEACLKLAAFDTTHASRFDTALMYIDNVMQSEHVLLGDSFPAYMHALVGRKNAEATRELIKGYSLDTLGASTAELSGGT
ncbi:hypothetical protein FOA52_000569 [Chlamydomonas sp. UWO 241]|nr:hypothetical protein FOA52_000569 [Chlamydomonas sp. UWO 241]